MNVDFEKAPAKIAELKAEIGKAMIGQESVVDQLLICFFSSGHALLTGVPGLGKTLLIQTVAHCVGLDFKRVQFVPDLMPSDILGTEIIQVNPETGAKEFIFREGPVFTNILMADEINRASPKTQSALLEVMQERTVSVGGKRRVAGEPFNVFATQNPLEFEGTYPLPEAQLDRFLMNIDIFYPSEAEETLIAEMNGFKNLEKCRSVMNAEEILALQAAVPDIPISRELLQRCVRLTRNTRPGEDSTLEETDQYVKWGAGPRAAQALVLTAKAAALIDGRFNVAQEDVDACFPPVMRHRIVLNYKADADNVGEDDYLRKVLSS